MTRPEGTQLHEMVVTRLHTGKPVGDIVDWEKPLFTGLRATGSCSNWWCSSVCWGTSR